MPELLSAAISEKTPLLTEDMKKEALLQKLQNKVHFEKTVAASNAPTYAEHCTMAIPAWFVIEHGDKFQQSILLWSETSIAPWRVELHLSLRPPCSRPEVKITGGWRPFATANDLAVGDSLIFSLRAMSEFDVYVFRKTKRSVLPSATQAPRKQFYGFKISKEKGNASAVGSGDFVNHESSKGRLIADIITEKGEVRTWSRVKETPMRDWKGRIFFEKILTAGAVSARFQLPLPKAFVQLHGDKIRKHVVLQSVADRKMWTVNLSAHIPRNHLQATMCGAKWKAFVVANGLAEGDRLTFTLVAMSKFEVLILRSWESEKVVPPSVQGSVMKSKGSAFSQTSQPLTKAPEPQHVALTDKYVKMERASSSTVFAKKADVVGIVSNSTPGSSQSPPDMECYFFKRWCQRMSIEQEALATSFDNEDCHALSRNALPRLLKWSTGSKV